MDKRLNGSPQSGLLPDAHRIPMPDQPLEAPKHDRASQWDVSLARLAVLALVAGSTAIFAVVLYQVLSVDQPTPVQLVFLVLCTLCFAWISIGAASAVVGFASLVLARTPQPVPVYTGNERLALLFPVYREDPSDVCAAIDAISADLAATSAGIAFDIFILSDTQDEEERRTERAAYSALKDGLAGRTRVFARWRTPNTGKKAGNIRDWIENHGGAYPYFIVMDADSLMTGETICTLMGAMQERPRAGLIQTVPQLVGGTTIFAKLQQFAAGYYGPIVAAGLAVWHGPNGNYWGHNAIVRTAAFAAGAGLPTLSGRPPFGGHIMSHDFVEAALLRRARWEVWMLPHLKGSYEGCPPTLDDLIVRDRRWAQGNLQHLRIVGARGLTLLSRLHLALGAWAYLASALWAVTLLVGVILAVQGKYELPTYFSPEASLFPRWPVFDARKALALFIATLFVVHLPKILGVLWAVRSAEDRRSNGGVLRILGGTLLESIMATLVAPLLMLTQTSGVAAILAGRDAGWGSQRRTGSVIAFPAYLRQYRWHIIWGLVALGVCSAISTAVLAWMSPIILGLLLAAPLARMTSAPAGPALARLLSTPPERLGQPLLQRVREIRASERWVLGRDRDVPIGAGRTGTGHDQTARA